MEEISFDMGTGDLQPQQEGEVGERKEVSARMGGERGEEEGGANLKL